MLPIFLAEFFAVLWFYNLSCKNRAKCCPFFWLNFLQCFDFTIYLVKTGRNAVHFFGWIFCTNALIFTICVFENRAKCCPFFWLNCFWSQFDVSNLCFKRGRNAARFSQYIFLGSIESFHFPRTKCCPFFWVHFFGLDESFVCVFHERAKCCRFLSKDFGVNGSFVFCSCEGEMLPVFLMRNFGVNRSFHFQRTKCCPVFWQIFFGSINLSFVFSREGEMLLVFLMRNFGVNRSFHFQGRNAARFSDNFIWARWIFNFVFSREGEMLPVFLINKFGVNRSFLFCSREGEMLPVFVQERAKCCPFFS